MSKSKKKNQQKTTQLSPENYIKQKARTLPIVECFITPDWEDCGECNIFVARQHTNGNYTVGVYLVDTFCVGIKDADYRFNIDDDEYTELKERFPGNFESVTYNEAHNIIFGALEYAEDLGFKPHKDFGVAQYILEEDTDDIPLIEYEFGDNGKPHLIVNSRFEANRYLPILQKAVGDDYMLLVREEDDDFEDDECGNDDENCDCELCCNAESDMSEEMKAKLLANLEKMQEDFAKIQSLPHTTYDYQYPDYPQSLDLTHKELEMLFEPENNEGLDKKTLDTILALPRESLIKDLENIVLYEIGQNCREISERNSKENIYGSITHALNLLAELKATESLPVVLEVMRQSSDFLDYFFGDDSTDILTPVVYQLAKNQLLTLLAYFKEPSLNPFFRIIVSIVFEMVVHYEPERRAEVIDLYGETLDFLFENINDTAYYDAGLTGMITNELINLEAKELLPKIKRLYDTGLVDKMCCGDYDEVEREVMEGNPYGSEFRHKVQSIYEIYK